MTQEIIYSLNSNAHIAITGEIGSATKIIRGAEWVVSFTIGQTASITRNGQPVTWQDATKEAHRFANKAAQFISAAFSR